MLEISNKKIIFTITFLIFGSFETHIRCEYLHPSRRLVRSAVLETKCHRLIIALPPGYCVPVQFHGLRFKSAIISTCVQAETFHSFMQSRNFEVMWHNQFRVWSYQRRAQLDPLFDCHMHNAETPHHHNRAVSELVSNILWHALSPAKLSVHRAAHLHECDSDWHHRWPVCTERRVLV
jgi:hypothetical protein